MFFNHEQVLNNKLGYYKSINIVCKIVLNEIRCWWSCNKTSVNCFKMTKYARFWKSFLVSKQFVYFLYGWKIPLFLYYLVKIYKISYRNYEVCLISIACKLLIRFRLLILHIQDIEAQFISSSFFRITNNISNRIYKNFISHDFSKIRIKIKLKHVSNFRLKFSFRWN